MEGDADSGGGVNRLILAAGFLAAALCAPFGGAMADTQKLGRYPADPAKVSISGISSGAFMANQVQIAHSAGIVGAGVVAGGPYGCAVAAVDSKGVQGGIATATGACMSAPSQLLSADDYAKRIEKFADVGWIDPVAGLTGQKLYAFTGKSDKVVNPAVVERGVAVYKALGVPASAIAFSDKVVNAGHSWVTLDKGNACDANATPYLDKCGYDQAQAVLKTIYGDALQPRAAEPAGKFVEFDQTEFLPGGQAKPNGMWDTGMLYVPPGCEAGSGTACTLHVVLHGCLQSVQVLKDTFYKNIGMNEWADNNHILLLYPQARTVLVQDFPKPGVNDLANINPQGCWNWFGYGYDNRFLFKDGKQIAAIWGMIQRVTGQGNQ